MKADVKTAFRVSGLLLLFIVTISLRENSNPPEPGESQVTFDFIHKVGNDPLLFDTIIYKNAFGNNYCVSTLRYFISNISLTGQDGRKLLLEDVHYIDAVNGKSASFAAARKVPAGNYSQISFIFGLDRSTNVSGRFTNPPENRMEWPETMGGGFHYMKLEGRIDSDGEITNYQAHTGQLNGTPHYINIELKVPPFKADSKGVTLRIIMDINEWWKDPNILDLKDVTAIMDNSRIQQQLMENGADVFSVGKID